MATVAPEKPVKVRTVYGDSVFVNQSDIDSGKTMIRMRDKNGAPKQGDNTIIHRDNLDPTGEKQQANNAKYPTDVITLSGDRAYASEAAAKQGAKKNGVTATHEVIPASEVSPGTKGFVLRKKAEQTTDATAAPEAAPAMRQGTVGIKLAAGESVKTSSGRTTTPFPKVATTSKRTETATRKAQRHVRHDGRG